MFFRLPLRPTIILKELQDTDFACGECGREGVDYAPREMQIQAYHCVTEGALTTL